MTIKLYYSNRIEDLCAMLAGNVCSVTRNPLEPARVFVPNPYVRAWVQIRLASAGGVAANIDYQLLDDGLWKIIRKARGGSGPVLAGEREVRLLVYHLLAGRNSGRDTSPFVSYLGGPEGPDREKKAWQLAGRLANLFIAYETRRPEMVDGWRKGRLAFGTEMEKAQRGLYLSVLGKDGLCARVCGSLTLPGHADEIDFSKIGNGLPELHFFCESGLSPFHCGVIFELGKKADVVIYQVNPCSEFWEDMDTAAEERWKKIKSVKIGEDTEGEFLEPGTGENRLLQLWGRAGREDVRLMGLVEDASGADTGFEAQWIGADAPAGADTVLGQIQRRVLARTASGEPLLQDTSLQVFRAPTVRREVEAVYASVLSNLENDPSLRMTDIAVMVPDMETYAPHIRFVFGKDPGRVSYAMIDSTAAGESAAGAAVMSLLDLAMGNFTRSEVFALVMNPVFQHARGIGAREAEIWLSWADRLNIFRGYSAGGEMEAFSWMQGLRKLRLGRIMEDPGGARPLSYKGVVPYSDMNSSDRDAVGSLSETIELLHSALDGMRQGPHGAREWREFFDTIITDFISVPQDMRHEEKVVRELRAAVAELEVLDRALEGGGASEKKQGGMTLAFIREYISDSLASMPGFHGRYLVSGVNISALVPRRNIPFRICYILGMGEGPFPGTAERSSLDLMSLHRRIGDVSRPDANGYLFLQTLLSASGKVYLSYVSRDLQKDQDLEPNSLVAQLVSHVEETIVGRGFRQADVPLAADDFSCLPGGEGDDWQDVVSFGDAKMYHITSSSVLDRFMFVRGLVKGGAGLERAVVEKYSALEREFTPDFRGAAVSVPPRFAAGSLISITMRDLCAFLEDPAASRLARVYGLGPNIIAEDPLIYNDEPLFSGYPDNYTLVNGAIERYVLTGDEGAGAAWLEESYHRSSMTGRTPAGAFMRVDMDSLMNRAGDRIIGAGRRPGLRSFLGERAGIGPARGVRLGEAEGECEIKMPPLAMTVRDGDQSIAVEIGGTLPLLWKRDDGCETLVLNGSASPRPRHIIAPFLFYAAAASGLHEELHSLAGTGAFYAHIETGARFETWKWVLAPGQAREFLERLVHDYLFDLPVYSLPAAIVLHKSILGATDFTGDASGEARAAYRDRFVRALRDETEKNFAVYTPSDLVYMLDPPVPGDAYDIARARFGLLLTGAGQAGPAEDE